MGANLAVQIRYARLLNGALVRLFAERPTHQRLFINMTRADGTRFNPNRPTQLSLSVHHDDPEKAFSPELIHQFSAPKGVGVRYMLLDFGLHCLRLSYRTASYNKAVEFIDEWDTTWRLKGGRNAFYLDPKHLQVALKSWGTDMSSEFAAHLEAALARLVDAQHRLAPTSPDLAARVGALISALKIEILGVEHYQMTLEQLEKAVKNRQAIIEALDFSIHMIELEEILKAAEQRWHRIASGRLRVAHSFLSANFVPTTRPALP